MYFGIVNFSLFIIFFIMLLYWFKGKELYGGYVYKLGFGCLKVMYGVVMLLFG